MDSLKKKEARIQVFMNGLSVGGLILFPKENYASSKLINSIFQICFEVRIKIFLRIILKLSSSSSKMIGLEKENSLWTFKPMIDIRIIPVARIHIFFNL